MIPTLVLGLLLMGQAPDHDFLPDPRVEVLERELAAARAALDAERAARTRLERQLAGYRQIHTRMTAASGAAQAEQASALAGALERAARAELRAGAAAPAGQAPAGGEVIVPLSDAYGRHIATYLVPAGATVTGYDTVTGQLHYIPPR
jgi:hypothetical protein